MGLSNSERIQGVLHSIRRIQPLARELESKETLDVSLKEQCERLWVEVFRNVSNSSHWILGSSSLATVGVDADTPWGLAVKAGIQNCKEQTEFEKSLDRPQFIDRFSIAEFLRAGDKHLALTYRIYQETENITYSLRRYSDDFLKKYEGLSALVSQIMGTCFQIFHAQQDLCAKAYLLHNIIDSILSYPYSEEDETDTLHMDTITRFFNELVLSFAVFEPMAWDSVVTTKDLALMYKHLDERKETTEAKKFETKLFYLLRICNRKLHDSYTHAKIKKFVKETKLKIDLKALDKSLEDSIKIHDAREVRDSKEYQDRQKFNEQYLYEEIK